MRSDFSSRLLSGILRTDYLALPPPGINKPEDLSYLGEGFRSVSARCAFRKPRRIQARERGKTRTLRESCLADLPIQGLFRRAASPCP